MKIWLKHHVFDIALEAVFRSITASFAKVVQDPHVVKTSSYWCVSARDFSIPPWTFSVGYTFIFGGQRYEIFER